MKLYEKLYDEIKNQIEANYYHVNQKLPSLRSISYQKNVSITTALEAYRLLEDSGYVISKPQSGYFVQLQRVKSLITEISKPEQKPVKVGYWDEVLSLTATKNQEGFIALGRGSPDSSISTLKPLQRIHNEIIRSRPLSFLNSESGNGYLPLREKIVYLMSKSGCELQPDEIIITTGCQEALSLSLKALTKPKDIVAIDSPSFYGSIQAIKSNGLRAIEIPTHPETGISLAALELALEQWNIKAIQLVPTSNNPLGYIMPDSNKIQLLKLASKFNVTIIEDDIYGDLIYENPRPRSIKSYDTEGKVILCSSFSKTVASGMRIGWVAAGSFSDVIAHSKFISSLASTSLPQIALTEFIEQGCYDKHLRFAKKQYKYNRDRYINWIQRYFPSSIKMSNPKGGFNLWIELPKGIDTLVLNKSLLKMKIGIAPGTLFSCTGKYSNCFRISYASKPSKEIEKAIQLLGVQIEELEN